MAITKDKANTIESASSYKKVQAKMDAVLNVLAAMPDRKIEEPSGRATNILRRLMPEDLIKQKGTEAHAISAFSTLLKMMEERGGWIHRNMNGKKTYSIELVKEPNDWSPTVYPWLEQRLTDISGNGEVPKKEEVVEPEPEPEAEVITPEAEATLEEEAKEGGIRAGRLASRLERLETSIGAQVEDAVSAGISGFFAQLAVSLGFEKPQSEESEAIIADLMERLTQAQQLITGLQDDLRAERISNSNGREELNRALRKQYATRDTSPVQASELSEAWRSLARHAIANGWTLHRTGGGHIMWKSPTGFRYFSSSTSSDYRSVRNARADMEKEGLPKE